MLILKYPAPTPQTRELEERLRELSLAYRSEEDRQLGEPQLVEGKAVFIGPVNIKSHLDELARELYFWQYCNCAPADA